MFWSPKKEEVRNAACGIETIFLFNHTHSNFMILEVTKLFRNTQTKRTNQICMGECGCGKNLGRKKKKKLC